MATKDKNQVIERAVQVLKDSKYGVTGIKVELEASLNRGRNNTRPGNRDLSGRCLHCDEGQTRCDDCSYCDQCDGDGYYYNGEDDRIDCEDCNGSGREGCYNCNDGYVECVRCEGN